jgi:hypothetical protein
MIAAVPPGPRYQEQKFQVTGGSTRPDLSIPLGFGDARAAAMLVLAAAQRCAPARPEQSTGALQRHCAVRRKKPD